MPTYDVRLHLRIKAPDHQVALDYAHQLAEALCDTAEERLLHDQPIRLEHCCIDNLDEVQEVRDAS